MFKRTQGEIVSETIMDAVRFNMSHGHPMSYVSRKTGKVIHMRKWLRVRMWRELEVRKYDLVAREHLFGTNIA